jgi:hypothetical protein
MSRGVSCRDEGKSWWELGGRGSAGFEIWRALFDDVPVIFRGSTDVCNRGRKGRDGKRRCSKEKWVSSPGKSTRKNTPRDILEGRKTSVQSRKADCREDRRDEPEEAQASRKKRRKSREKAPVSLFRQPLDAGHTLAHRSSARHTSRRNERNCLNYPTPPSSPLSLHPLYASPLPQKPSA